MGFSRDELMNGSVISIIRLEPSVTHNTKLSIYGGNNNLKVFYTLRSSQPKIKGRRPNYRFIHL